MKNKEQDHPHILLEKKWNSYWSINNIYSFINPKDEKDNREVFAIDTPPPTISGSLHMGHIYSYTHTDFIARFQRMIGKRVFYPIGLDNNGLPTERLVEKIHNVRGSNMERGGFVDLAEKTIETAKDEYINLFKSVGLSMDFKYEYSTISKSSQRVSQESFIDLYNKNLMVRRKSPTLWDVVDKTALAQAEIVDRHFDSTMNNIVFKVENGDEVVIATTRPELLAACVAVFFHPDDERYAHLKDKIAITPIFAAKVPIIPDKDVDISKGTGLVMCCTFGDMQDIEWWKRHNLTNIECINLDGKMQNTTILDGLTIKEANAKIISILFEKGLIKEQKKITHSVKCGERSNSPVEIIVTPQWYVSLLHKKEEILEKVREIDWHPKYMRVRIEQWIDGLHQDWCISRQRYFGVPFPVWYSKRKGEEGKIIVCDPEDLPVDPTKTTPKGYKAEEVEGDADVMDTWATSSLTPKLSLSTIDKKVIDEHNNNLTDISSQNKIQEFLNSPFQLRPQSHEIIRTWAFYTIVKSLYHENKVPWQNVVVSGWCLANDKTKMSKSKGNVITPQGLLKEHGADMVRYWASTGKLGADISYSEDIFKVAKKLTLKLQNACNFLFVHLEKFSLIEKIELEKINLYFGDFNTIDKWLISELILTITSTSKSFELFEYSEARNVIEKFFWHILCDNYLEIIKDRIYNGSKNEKRNAILAIAYCLKNVLALLAPFIPYICEELNYQLFQKLKNHPLDGNISFEYLSIHLNDTWPKADNSLLDKNAIESGVFYLEFIEIIRKFKSSRNISLGEKIQDIKIYSKQNLSQSVISDLRCVAKAANITHIENIDEVERAVSAAISIIDKDQESPPEVAEMVKVLGKFDRIFLTFSNKDVIVITM